MQEDYHKELRSCNLLGRIAVDGNSRKWPESSLSPALLVWLPLRWFNNTPSCAVTAGSNPTAPPHADLLVIWQTPPG